MKINALITDRWSPVAFDSKAVDSDKIYLLFEAASWAPSSRNRQPWRFIYVTSSDSEYPAVLDLLSPENRIWAQTAPLLVLSVAEVISSYKNRANYYAFYDTGMAVSNLLLQATELGLLVHQMGGYDMDRAKELFRIPERFEPLAMMAIGYKGDPSGLPEDIASRERRNRVRNIVDDFVFRGNWRD